MGGGGGGGGGAGGPPPTESVLVDLPFVSSLLQPINCCHRGLAALLTPNGRGCNEKWVGSEIFRTRKARDYM